MLRICRGLLCALISSHFGHGYQKPNKFNRVHALRFIHRLSVLYGRYVMP